MEFNPLTKTCADLANRIASLQECEKQVVDELEWYRKLDPTALDNDRRSGEARADLLQRVSQALGDAIRENITSRDETSRTTGTLFNPRNWFAKDQIALRRKLAELHAVGNQKSAEMQSTEKELNETRSRVAGIVEELGRYRAFDFPRQESELSRIRQVIASKQKELAKAADQKQQVDDAISPLVREIQALESRKLHTQSDIDAAEDFRRQLSSASNSRERAIIHERCERQLGDGSPQRIISERMREIRQLERDVNKAKDRVADVARKAARRIESIVIDGNNLCYEGWDFIGLGALEAILPSLSRKYSVVIVFDHSIFKHANSNEPELRERFCRYAKVHVVNSGHMADETLLDLAGASEFAYVLSNDKFSDFREKPVVKDGRFIRHEIVNGHVFVHDFQLRERIDSAPREAT